MRRTRKKKSGYGKKILLTLLVITLSMVMAGGLYFFRLALKMEDDTPDVSNGKVIEDKNDENKDDDSSREENYITNILLIGTDNRNNGEGERSDAIIILTIDKKNKDMRLTSLMRDSYVHIPESNGRTDSWEKLNHSYAYGGAPLLMKTIQENFDIKLEKYVKIDFGGFKSVVEILDGIDVNINDNEELNELNRCLLLDIYDDPKKKGYTKFRNILEKADLLRARDEGAYRIKDNPKITRAEYNYIADIADFKWEIGNTHLDGRQTLAYSRMRHSTGGSFGRTSRQREVINLLINKLSGLNYLSLAEEMTNYVKTNMDIGEMIGVAKKVVEINNFDIKQMQVPPDELTEGRVYKGVYLFLMEFEQVKKAMHDFIFEDIDYNVNDYTPFEYRSSEYYYYEPPKPEKPAEDEDNESNDSEENNQDENQDINDENEDTNNEENTEDNGITDEEINEDDDSNNENSNTEDGSDGEQISGEDDNESEESDDSNNGINNPNEETDNPNEEIGYPNDEIGYPNDEIGYPNDEIGYPNEETDNPNEETDNPNEETDNPNEEIGYPNDETDNPNEEIGNPTEETNQGEDYEFEISEE